jgi:simple sugar transport system ATP-binding protein
VLKYVVQAKTRGLGVIFITHNPHHAYAVGDRFIVLKRGKTLGIWRKDEIEREELIRAMSGADELEALSHELNELARRKDIEQQAAA